MGHRSFGLLFPASLYRNRSRAHLWHWRFLGDLLANEVSGQPRPRYAAPFGKETSKDPEWRVLQKPLEIGRVRIPPRCCFGVHTSP